MSSTDQDSYFTNYEKLEVHEVMLTDKVRQDSYTNALYCNAKLIEDKVVLDVGAGTGILAAACAHAGARLVYAVEASNMAKIALETIEENDMTSVVKVIQSKIEDFELPAGAEKVDVIISEFMGFYLLHEGMLDSVIYARDHFLKEDGIMFPCQAILYAAPCSVPKRYDYWQNVNGISMTRFGERLRKEKSTKPEIVQIDYNDLLCEGVLLKIIDLKTVAVDDLDELTFKKVISTQRPGKLQGFCIWFECEFPGEDPVFLSTGPEDPPTHWKQCLITLPPAACEILDSKAPIGVGITMKRNPNNRRKYDLELEMLDPFGNDHPVPCNCDLTKCIVAAAHLERVRRPE